MAYSKAQPLSTLLPLQLARFNALTPVTPEDPDGPVSYGMAAGGSGIFQGRVFRNVGLLAVPAGTQTGVPIPLNSDGSYTIATGSGNLDVSVSTDLLDPSEPVRIRIYGSATAVGFSNVNGAAESDVTTGSGLSKVRELVLTPAKDSNGRYINVVVQFARGDGTTRIVKPIDAREKSADLNQMFYPPAIADFAKMGDGIRGMYWTNTLGNHGATLAVTWDQRPKTNWAFFGEPMCFPFEWLADFAVEAGTTAWVNVPLFAKQDFIYGLLSMLHAKFPADKKIKLELGNEVGNPGFGAYQYMTDYWTANHAGNPSDATPFGRVCAQYIENFNYFSDQVKAWGQANGVEVGKDKRFERVLGDFIDSYVVQQGIKDNNGVSMFAPSKIDSVCTDGYFGYNVCTQPSYAADAATAISRMTIQLGTSETSVIDRKITAMVAKAARYAANGHGFHMYEGNFHGGSLASGDYISRELNRSISEHPDFEPVFSYYLRQLRRRLPSAASIMLWDYMSPVTEYGTFGVRGDYIFQPESKSPRWRALKRAVQGLYDVLPARIVGTAPPPAQVGSPYNWTPDTRLGEGAGAVRSYAFDAPNLYGLTFNTTTGKISGTPTATGTIAGTLTPSDGAGAGIPYSVSIAIASGQPMVQEGSYLGYNQHTAPVVVKKSPDGGGGSETVAVGAAFPSQSSWPSAYAYNPRAGSQAPVDSDDWLEQRAISYTGTPPNGVPLAVTLRNTYLMTHQCTGSEFYTDITCAQNAYPNLCWNVTSTGFLCLQSAGSGFFRLQKLQNGSVVGIGANFQTGVTIATGDVLRFRRQKRLSDGKMVFSIAKITDLDNVVPFYERVEDTEVPLSNMIGIGRNGGQNWFGAWRVWSRAD